MEYCSYLYQLIRDRSTDAKVATEHIENHRDILKNNAPRATELRKELSWLFPSRTRSSNIHSPQEPSLKAFLTREKSLSPPRAPKQSLLPLSPRRTQVRLRPLL